MDKKIIARDFSRCASAYDRYADIQRRAGIELLGLIEKDGIRRILEIGCGTGNYTLLLSSKFKDAKVKTVDISERMIEQAEEKLKDRNVEFAVADAERMELEKDFDLITSNACFQWFEDLAAALLKYKDRLSKNGSVSFSTFGPLTFSELNAALKEVVQNASTPAAQFPGREEIERILKQNFASVLVREERYEESFACLKDLLRKIKYSGIRGEGFGGRAFLSRQLLHKLEAAYLEKFQRIKATYQVFFCKAQKS